MKKPKVGVVIPFYHGDEYIIRCLQSLNSSYSERMDLSVYIIDNNNVESKFLEKIKITPNVIYTRTKSHIGYGRACNIGADMAMKDDCEYLIFLNQDTYVYPQMIEELVDVLVKENKPTIVSPMIFDYRSEQLREMYIRTYLMKNINYFTDSYSNKMKKVYALPNIGAACIGMSTKVIDTIGLFDPIFYMYAEDMDLMNRLKKNDGQVLLVTKARVAHLEATAVSPEAFLKCCNAIVKNEVRTGGNIFLLLLENFSMLSRWGGYKLGFRHLAKIFPVLINRKKYKALSIPELKKRITNQIKQDKI